MVHWRVAQFGLERLAVNQEGESSNLSAPAIFEGPFV